ARSAYRASSSVRKASSSSRRSIARPTSRLHAVAVSAISGEKSCHSTFTPSPTTTASPSRSARIPASFRFPTTRSLGHFSSGGSPRAPREALGHRTPPRNRAERRPLGRQRRPQRARQEERRPGRPPPSPPPPAPARGLEVGHRRQALGRTPTR